MFRVKRIKGEPYYLPMSICIPNSLVVILWLGMFFCEGKILLFTGMHEDSGANDSDLVDSGILLKGHPPFTGVNPYS